MKCIIIDWTNKIFESLIDLFGNLLFPIITLVKWKRVGRDTYVYPVVLLLRLCHCAECALIFRNCYTSVQHWATLYSPLASMSRASYLSMSSSIKISNHTPCASRLSLVLKCDTHSQTALQNDTKRVYHLWLKKKSNASVNFIPSFRNWSRSE